MKWRIIVTILLVLGTFIGFRVYEAVQGPVEANIAVAQLEDSAIAYSASRAVVEDELIPNLALQIYLGILLIIWLPPAIRYAINNPPTTCCKK